MERVRKLTREKQKGRGLSLINLDEPEDDEPTKYDDTLRKKTRRSIGWTLVRIASDQVFSFIVFVILARLLSPSEFGAFALAVAFSEVGRVIAVSGMVQNIARAQRMSPGLADTVFWTNLAMSVAVALVVLALAPLVMDLIGQPDATAPLQALGLVLPIVALGATHLSLRLREFGHKSLALRSVAGGTIGGAAAIAAAFAGWGIWSLVVQRFVTEAVNAIMSWHAYKWLPGRNVSWLQLRAIWGFGFDVTLTQILSLLPRRATDVVVGAMIDTAAVGIFRTARRTNELILSGTVHPFTTVAMQTLARLQANTEELVKAYRWMLSKSTMLTIPAFVGFGVLAPDAVPAIFGAQWAHSGEIVQILTFMVVSSSFSNFTGPLLMAIGRASSLRTFTLGQVISTVVFVAAAAPFGLIAVAWASVARSYLALPFQLWLLRRTCGIRPRDTFAAIAAPLAASLIMGAGVWALMLVIRPYFEIVLIPIFICVAAGVALYAIALYALSAEARKLLRTQLKAWRTRRRA